eukprot:gene4107-14209_t
MPAGWDSSWDNDNWEEVRPGVGSAAPVKATGQKQADAWDDFGISAGTRVSPSRHTSPQSQGAESLGSNSSSGSGAGSRALKLGGGGRGKGLAAAGGRVSPLKGISPARAPVAKSSKKEFFDEW